MVATKQLIILGNGFDLANDLETSYDSFLNWIIAETDFSVSEIQKEYSRIDEYYNGEFPSTFTVNYRASKQIKVEPIVLPDMFKINIWYLLLIHSKISRDANWSDVEAQMYKYLVYGELLEIPFQSDGSVREFQKLLQVILVQVQKINITDQEQIVSFFEQSLHELERDFERFLWNGYTKLDRKNRGIIYPSKGNRKCLVKLRNVPLIQKNSNANS